MKEEATLKMGAASAWGRVIRPTVLLGVLWAGLNGADWRSWLVGAPAVVVAAWVAVKLAPAVTWRWTLRGMAGFAWFFLCESFRGGFDVARRVCSPALRLQPGMIRYAPALPEGSARWFFAAAISLLPGTAVVELSDEAMCVHALDLSRDPVGALQQLEARVAALFGLELARQREVAP